MEPFEYCVWLLSKRSYSKKELILKMRRKAIAAAEIDNTIIKLEAYKYLLDETALSEQWVRHLCLKGKGPNFIEQTLRQKGLPVVPVPEDLEKASLRKALRLKKLNLAIFAKHDKDQAKASRYLVGRGFNLSRARQFIAQDLESET